MADQVQVPKSSKTVTVGCKMPGGLVLRLFQMNTEHEQVMGGGSREVKVARMKDEAVRINGCAVPIGGPQPKHMIIGGYGLTHGVDAEFFAEWMRQNAESKLVKNNMIFVASSRDAAESKAEEQAEIKSGLEPLDPTFITAKDGRIVPNDPRYPRSINPNITALHTAERVA